MSKVVAFFALLAFLGLASESQARRIIEDLGPNPNIGGMYVHFIHM